MKDGIALKNMFLDKITGKRSKKIDDGIIEAISRMVEKAKLLDEELVISENGKVKKIRARDLK